VAHFELPKRFLILPRDFSIETGELTPKLSVRRRIVEQRYAPQIAALYADAEAHPPP
jgi:long-chain acyl-CoA synthetase